MDPVKLTLQLNNVKTAKDGGGKITFEFSLDSLNEVHRLQKINGRGEMNFMVVCVPVMHSEDKSADEWESIQL
jgi:DNA repair ATPase RecN